MPAPIKLGEQVLVSPGLSEPAIAALPDGRYLAAWTHYNPALTSTDPSTISAQVFNVDGTPFGAEFLVTSADVFRQHQPEVTALSSGRFLLTWVDDSAQTLATGSSEWVRAQVYTADGTPEGSSYLISNLAQGWDRDLKTSALAGDRFVAVWVANRDFLPLQPNHDIRARVFNSDGSAVSTELVVNTDLAGQQTEHSVTTLSDGRFVVTWKHETPLGPGLGSSYGLKAQIFNADGTPAGNNISVLDGTGIPTDTSIAGLSNGGFVVSWSSEIPFGGRDVGIQAQVFDANGGKLGASFFVGPSSYDQPYTAAIQPNAVGLDNGRFLVTWSYGVSVYGEILEADGSPVGSTFAIASGALNTAYASPHVVSTSSDGRFTVAMMSTDGNLVSQTYSAEIQAWTLTGTPNRDTLVGDKLGDTISGLSGDDVLSGLGGNDTLDGGDGVDLASYREKTSSVSITLQESGDTSVFVDGVAEDTIRNIENLHGGSGADLLTGNSLVNTFSGGAGNDVLVMLGGDDYADGGSGNDYLYMGDGNDTAVGDEGIDVFVLGAGNDTAHGGGGQDYIYGGAGNDALYGNDGVNVLLGEDGNDYFLGGTDVDYVYGGSGDDHANGMEGNDIFVMGIGNDVAQGSIGQDYFYMGDGNDQAYGSVGVDVFLGEAGDDLFDGGFDVDYAWGGSGNDTYVMSGSNGVLVVQDFAAGGAEDAIRLISDTGITTLSGVLAAATYYAGMNTTIITIDADTAVWLVGVNKTQLTTQDFIFLG